MNGGWTPRHSDEPEWLDIETLLRQDLETNLADMALANRLLGTAGHLWSCLETLLRRQDRCGDSSLLDIGSGQADVVLALSRWAEKKEQGLYPIVSDLNATVLDVAMEHWRRDQSSLDVIAVRLDARALPFDDASVDLVSCCHTFHHFAMEQALSVLREMERVSRLGFVVIDLRRSLLSYWASCVLVKALGRSHRLAYHDGPLSVLRSFTEAEMLEMSKYAGIQDVTIRSFPCQIALVRDKGVR